MTPILCLDPGMAHTGIAISHEGILAEPLTTIFERNPQVLIGRLTPLIARLNPHTIVIGSPSHGPLVKTAQDISDRLSAIFQGKIEIYNEDLSSRKAKTHMRETNKKINSRSNLEHQTAAAFILQDYLDSL
jgi:putative transcription antitermination factor YqgF